MSTALVLFGYAVAVSLWAPALLGWLTADGISARLGLTAWLTAMASALISAAAALQFLARAAVAGWSRLAEVVCRSVSGHACTATGYQGAAVEFGLGALAIVAGLAAMVLAWRYGRSVQRAQQRTRAHADVARITGRRCPEATAPWLSTAPSRSRTACPAAPPRSWSAAAPWPCSTGSNSVPCWHTSVRTWPAATTC